MDRRGFLNQVWKGNIKPIIIFAILICIGLIVLNFDFSKIQNFSINWSGIIQLFVFIIRDNWQALTIIFSLVFLFILLKKLVPQRYHKLLQRIFTVIVYTLLIGVVGWFGYKFYQNKEYDKITRFIIIFIILAISGYLQKRDKTPAAKEP